MGHVTVVHSDIGKPAQVTVYKLVIHVRHGVTLMENAQAVMMVMG